jgi:chorismate mutase
MQDLVEKVRTKLQSGIKISVIQRETQVSRHWINKIIKGDEVPSYLITTLNDYFKKFGE